LMSALLPSSSGVPVKFVRTLIVAAVAVATTVAVQMAGSAGASAAPIHVNDCGACWQIVQE